MKEKTVLLNQDTWEQQKEVVGALVRAYAIEFWSSTWKELLVVRDDSGEIVQQFGSVSGDGKPFSETLELLARTGISADHPEWSTQLWELADTGVLQTRDGLVIAPFWTLESAREALRRFVAPTSSGGFGGEMIVLMEDSTVVGFSAYACHRGETGRDVADRRFPIKRLHIPLENDVATNLSVNALLKVRFPGERVFGVFLDHAVGERYRGQGLGSRLFDLRLERMLELGTDVFFGRTMTTAVSQYIGNYLKRGLRPIAADGTDAFSRAKHLFVAEAHELRDRVRTIPSTFRG